MSIIKNYYLKVRNAFPPYPGLRYNTEDGKKFWEGNLRFVRRYDSIRIKDSFNIRIELNKRSFPTVTEIGGRMDAIQLQRNIKDRRDLHVDPKTDIICLCARPEEKKIFPGRINLKKFIEKLVIPFFFSLSYFEKTGEWIWGDYSHGSIGIIEYYLENRDKNDPQLLNYCIAELKMTPEKFRSIKINKRTFCFCGSKKLFKKCHEEAFAGVKLMQKDLINLSSK